MGLNDTTIGTTRRLVKKVLGRTKDEEHSDGLQTMSNLRDVLYKMAHQFRSQSQDKRITADLMEMLMVVHYQVMLFTAQSFGLREIAAKCAITLLKYPDLLPHDKAFYQAGLACREQGNINLSFLLFNRYVDISEAIDCADISILDFSDLQDADAIPNMEHLPTKHYLGNEVREYYFYIPILSLIHSYITFYRMIAKKFARGFCLLLRMGR